MAELKTKKTTASVASFLKSLDDERRAECQTLVRLMSEATGAKPAMWGSSIVGFGRYQYKYDTGRTGEWFQTGFAPRKGNLTLYIIPGIGVYRDMLDKLGPHKTGVSCLYVRRLADLDMKVLKKIVTGSVKKLKQAAK